MALEQTSIVIKTVAKTALGNIKGNAEMYNGGNIDEILNDLVRQLDAKLTSAMHYKGTVAAYENLPDASVVGDVYNVTATGKNYAWDGTQWDELSGVMDLSAYKTDAENEAKYLQIANFSTKAKAEGFRTETEIRGYISTAFTSYGFGTLSEKSEVERTDLAADLASELDAKATQAALEAVDAKFADYTKTADLKALAFKDKVGKDDCTAEFQALIDAKATQAALHDLADRVTDTETAKADHARSIAEIKAKFANYTETKDLGVLALLNEEAAQRKLNEWGYVTDLRVDPLAGSLERIAGVQVPTKETITIYELWDCVNAIVKAAGTSTPA